jgi:hypothetical protein
MTLPAIDAVVRLTRGEAKILRFLGDQPTTAGASIERMVGAELGTDNSLRVYIHHIRRFLAATPYEIVTTTIYELRPRPCATASPAAPAAPALARSPAA